METVRRSNTAYHHLIAIMVLWLVIKPIVIGGLMVGIVLAWIARSFITADLSYWPYAIGALAAIGASFSLLSDIYRRVLNVEAGSQA